jgi:hypothetical protein
MQNSCAGLKLVPRGYLLAAWCARPQYSLSTPCNAQKHEQVIKSYAWLAFNQIVLRTRLPRGALFGCWSAEPCITASRCHAQHYRMKFYDHAWLDHVVNQSKALTELHMSLDLLSSKFLEANYKFVKAVLRRLPDGGMRRANRSHLPWCRASLIVLPVPMLHGTHNFTPASPHL